MELVIFKTARRKNDKRVKVKVQFLSNCSTKKTMDGTDAYNVQWVKSTALRDSGSFIWAEELELAYTSGYMWGALGKCPSTVYVLFDAFMGLQIRGIKPHIAEAMATATRLGLLYQQ